MGFWDTLLHGAAEVSHWVANNSGSILKATQTIAKVAGVLVSDEELLADDDNVLGRLYEYLDKAEKAMLTVAKKAVPFPNVGDPLKTVASGPFVLHAFWPSPPSASSPKVPLAESVNVNKFLALNKLPTSLGSGQNSTDIGEALAGQIFSGTAATTLVDTAFKTVNLNFKASDGTLVTGGHVYYEVPLGNPGTHSGWHSLIYLYFVQPYASLEALKEEKRMLSIKPRETNIAPDQPYNSTTVSVQWTGVRTTALIMSKALNSMLDSSGGSITFLKPSLVDGARFTYQFQTSTEMGPAEVQAALSTAISHNLPPITGAHSIPRMSSLAIENMQTYIP